MIQLSEIVEIENRPARPVTRQQATTPGQQVTSQAARSARRRLANGTGAVTTVEAPPEWDEADLAAEAAEAANPPETPAPAADDETLDR